eukprot:scaffold45339_cov37-Prasinocladus_malaysianus.AAC.1
MVEDSALHHRMHFAKITISTREGYNQPYTPHSQTLKGQATDKVAPSRLSVYVTKRAACAVALAHKKMNTRKACSGNSAQQAVSGQVNGQADQGIS